MSQMPLREQAVEDAKARLERARTTTEKHEARRDLQKALRALEASKAERVIADHEDRDG